MTARRQLSVTAETLRRLDCVTINANNQKRPSCSDIRRCHTSCDVAVKS